MYIYLLWVCACVYFASKTTVYPIQGIHTNGMCVIFGFVLLLLLLNEWRNSNGITAHAKNNNPKQPKANTILSLSLACSAHRSENEKLKRLCCFARRVCVVYHTHIPCAVDIVYLSSKQWNKTILMICMHTRAHHDLFNGIFPLIAGKSTLIGSGWLVLWLEKSNFAP